MPKHANAQPRPERVWWSHYRKLDELCLSKACIIVSQRQIQSKYNVWSQIKEIWTKRFGMVLMSEFVPSKGATLQRESYIWITFLTLVEKDSVTGNGSEEKLSKWHRHTKQRQMLPTNVPNGISRRNLLNVSKRRTYFPNIQNSLTGKMITIMVMVYSMKKHTTWKHFQNFETSNTFYFYLRSYIATSDFENNP